jgi:hypothetical protein
MDLVKVLADVRSQNRVVAPGALQRRPLKQLGGMGAVLLEVVPLDPVGADVLVA